MAPTLAGYSVLNQGEIETTRAGCTGELPAVAAGHALAHAGDGGVWAVGVGDAQGAAVVEAVGVHGSNGYIATRDGGRVEGAGIAE